LLAKTIERWSSEKGITSAQPGLIDRMVLAAAFTPAPRLASTTLRKRDRKKILGYGPHGV